MFESISDFFLFLALLFLLVCLVDPQKEREFLNTFKPFVQGQQALFADVFGR